MTAAVLQLCPSANNKKLLAETKYFFIVSTKQGVNIGPTKPSLDNDGRINLQWACGRTVASGNINKHQYIRPLLENAELDIIAIPVRACDKSSKKKGKKREHSMRLYIWGVDQSQLVTNDHVMCYN